jgi:uncharacterized membrane protein
MMLMTVDHASGAFNKGRLVTDAARLYEAGAGLPAGQFMLRWMTHLCAPTFVFLAGTALGLSVERRRRAGQNARRIDGELVLRGLLIAAVDPLLVSFFWGGSSIMLQVMYAIGLSLVAMAGLRRLPTTWLLAGAAALLVGSEFFTTLVQDRWPGTLAGTFLLHGGRIPGVIVAYPVVPWLCYLLLGWVGARYLLSRSHDGSIQLPLPQLAGAGVFLGATFLVVRGMNHYGNMSLFRDDLSLVQWLHVSKYPPSLSFTTLELSVMVLLVLLLALVAGNSKELSQRNPLLVFGQTPLFFYILHIPLLELGAHLSGLGQQGGILMTLVASVAAWCLLYPLCLWYRRLKRAYPQSALRFI